MTTLIIHHEKCSLHDPGPRHPEGPRRMAAILAALEGLAGLEFLPAPRAAPRQLGRVHPPAYQREVRNTEPAEGRAAIHEHDNLMSPGSFEAALRAAGAVCFAVDEIMSRRGDVNAFCVVRPPGHHAETGRAMGFCLFNNIAVGARHAQAKHGLERIAVIDFDVHHGNGTQAIFCQDASILYVSSHQMPLYPGGGSAEETGCGNIVNMPLEPGAGSRAFRDCWENIGLPAVTAFAPELILVSAGFDAHASDPLAHIELQAEDYRWITRQIKLLAAENCSGRLVSSLEGGYDLEALGACARAHAEALANPL